MPDKLIDLAYTKAELKEEAKEMRVGLSGEPSKYPWGLCIRLEKEELDKLGIKQLPGVGDEYHMTIITTVTEVSQSAGMDRDDSACVALQITMASVDMHETAKEEKAEGKQTPAKEAAEGKSIMSSYRS
jgi:hypothetical protein